MAKKWAASTEETFKVVQEQAASVAARLKDAEKEAYIAREQVKEAEEYLRNVERKLETTGQSTSHQRLLMTNMLAELDEEHTACVICTTKFSTDTDNTNENIRKHLPVLSSSQKCDHYFCHGCILRDQQRVAELKNGRVPRWLKCMICKENTSFCPSEPKYHRLLIDLLRRVYCYADAQVKEEEKEEAQDSSKVAVTIHKGEESVPVLLDVIDEEVNEARSRNEGEKEKKGGHRAGEGGAAVDQINGNIGNLHSEVGHGEEEAKVGVAGAIQNPTNASNGHKPAQTHLSSLNSEQETVQTDATDDPERCLFHCNKCDRDMVFASRHAAPGAFESHVKWCGNAVAGDSSDDEAFYESYEAKPIDPDELRAGSRVLVLCSEGKGWQATIKRPQEKQGVPGHMIHYDGLKKSAEYWVANDSIVDVLHEGETKCELVALNEQAEKKLAPKAKAAKPLDKDLIFPSRSSRKRSRPQNFADAQGQDLLVQEDLREQAKRRKKSSDIKPFSANESWGFELGCVKYGWGNWEQVLTFLNEGRPAGKGRTVEECESHAAMVMMRHPEVKERLNKEHNDTWV